MKTMLRKFLASKKEATEISKEMMETEK